MTPLGAYSLLTDALTDHLAGYTVALSVIQ